MHPSSLSSIPFPFPIFFLLFLLLPFLPPSHSYPHPLPLSTTPQTSPRSPPQDRNPTSSILHTLNLFSSAVDTHNYTLFSSIFASDAHADFDDGKGELVGLEGITRALAEGLRGKRSWHGLSTQVVDFDYGDDGAGDGDGDGDGAMAVRARASSYLQGTFFGMGNLTGQIVTTYGRYVVAFFLYSFLCYVMLCSCLVWSVEKDQKQAPPERELLQLVSCGDRCNSLAREERKPAT